MNFNEHDLQSAQRDGIISVEICDKLLEYLKSTADSETDASNLAVTAENNTVEQEGNDNSCNATALNNNASKFNIENFLYYFGGFIIISTMAFYLGCITNTTALFVAAILYFILFVRIGNSLWEKDKKTPGGLLYVCAVSITPVFVWAFEKIIGFLPEDLKDYSQFHRLIRSGYMFMELATIFVGLTFLKYRKFPLLTLPICYAMWYLSMDIVPFLLGSEKITWGMRNFSSCAFALVMLVYAINLDRDKQNRDSEDFSNWLYIFGATMLWGAVISILARYRWKNDLHSLNYELAYFLTGLFNFAYMFIGILVKRKVFMVWGAIGFWTYLGYLAYNLFSNTFLFPFILVGFGLSLIYFGIYYSKNCKILEEKLRKRIGFSK